MELLLKPEIEDNYLFCKIDIINGDAVLQQEDPMTPSAMSARLRSLGKIHSWLHSMFRMAFDMGEERC